MKILSFAAILVTVCAVAACSDDDNTGGEGGAGGGGGASSATTSSASSSTVTTTGTTTGTGGSGEGGNGEGGEGGEGGGVDCPTQCFDDNQAGALEFFQLTLDTCGCAEGASCASACDTADAETDVCDDDGSGNILALQDNEACVDCVDGLADEDACLATVKEGCDASEGCTAFADCVAACP
ncbi:hypothetical protein WME99_40500 [Sorangium sp. So ce136]|uniref:hypothetical protein n=1 Tax=Sorangium sp. So ce136 TaxID=3133284 RepID=UPI003F0B9E55